MTQDTPDLKPARLASEFRGTAMWIGGLALTVAATAIVAWGTFPLGIPGEWVWQRQPPDSGWFANGIHLALAGSLYLGVTHFFRHHLEAAHTASLTARLTVLAACGFFWLWVLQEAAPTGFQLSKTAWVLYFRGPSGYFLDARSSKLQRQAYLQNYETQLAQGDVLHAGTHPPGLIIAYWGLFDLCESSPEFTSLLRQSRPDSVRLATRELIKEPLAPVDEAVLWLAGLSVQALAALGVIPLFGWLSHFVSRRTSWVCAAVWPLVPAVAIFLPKSDVLLAVISVIVLWLWTAGIHLQGARARLFVCGLAGLSAWLGLSISLALLPAIALCGTTTLGLVWIAPASGRQSLFRQVIQGFVAAAGFFLVATVCFHLATGLNLINAWLWCYRNHAGFYLQYPRTYWKWLLVNPCEWSISSGLPVAALALVAMYHALRKPVENVRARCLTLAVIATWALLWLSGKNSGEVARLWICLIPWLLAASASTLDTWRLTSPATQSRLAWGLLVAQMACTVLMATRVVGFHI